MMARMDASGAGWAATDLETLGEGPGMRKVRTAIGVSAFGLNTMVLAPRTRMRWHWHDEQQEVYFVHAGTLSLEFDDGLLEAPAGSFVRVDAETPRRISNRGGDELVLVAIGGRGGYVGRDGQLRADELAEVGAGAGMGFVPLEA
jgi:mannose-6-phosphate isomerase-like protein (cupin superfamily)